MTTTIPAIHGTCDPAFEWVRETLAVNFERRGEVGASVAVTRDGEFVVDLWGGTAGPDGAPWQRDTIVNVYSTTKTMAATCVLMLIDQGKVDPDAPVADYWPEFAANGKDGVLVRHVMSHSAGLAEFDPQFASPEELYDWDLMTQRLAAQAPQWEPGTESGYHSITQGYLQGEIVRRVTGRTIGTFFREEVAEPLGADFHIGLAPEHDHRVGELIPPPPDPAAPPNPGRGALTALEPRTAGWRRAEIPAAGGFGNARAASRVQAALACGGTLDCVRLMSAATVESVLSLRLGLSGGTSRIVRSMWSKPPRKSVFWSKGRIPVSIS